MPLVTWWRCSGRPAWWTGPPSRRSPPNATGRWTGSRAPTRLSAAGYGEFRPRGDNTTVEGRARNRRVDLVLLNEATALSEEPAGEVRP